MTRSARRIAWGAALLLLALGSSRAADDLRLRAYVDPAGTVADTDPVTLIIEVEGSSVPDVSVPGFPALTNLKVISGPSTSRSTSFELRGTSMQRASTTTLRYVLLPLGPGLAVIPPISVRLGNDTRTTGEIRLQVARVPSGPSPRSRADRGEAGTDSRRGGGAEVFLRATAVPAEPWVNQPVFLTVTLWVAGTEVNRFSWMGMPTFNNAWVEEIAADPNAERRSEVVEGRRYNVYPVLRRVLAPTAAGDLTIEPFAAQVEVRRATGDIFDDLFFPGRSAAVVRRSEPIRLKVRALPESGRPEDFGGAVGSFTLRASLDRREVQANDAVALKVVIEGDGSLQGVEAPRIAAPHDLKVFDPKVSTEARPADGRLVSRKTWEWVLVPLAPGEVRVPSVSLSFFDPQAGAYRSARSEPGVLTVRKGTGPASAPTARVDVKAQRQDVRYIKPLRGRLSARHDPLHRRGWFVALLVAPLLWLPAAIAVARYRYRLARDQGLARGHRARRRALKRLASASRRLAQADAGTFHEEVARALVEYLADRFDRSAAGLTYDVADDLLRGRGVDAALRGRFRACLERCDFARFVPGAADDARKAEVLAEARSLVDQIERAR